MAFGKTRKYKKVVKAIFPSQPGGEFQLTNISKLVYFCEMNPEQLQRVGPYIQQKAEKSLYKKRIDFVKACVIIIRELISQCRKNLVLFATNATKLMELLLQQDHLPDLQIEATETVQDDASLFPEVEKFNQYFITMSRNNSPDDINRRKIRGEGLRGISAYISILDLVDELDTFISNHREIISTILDNMQYRDQVPTPALARRNTQSENTDVNSALPANVKAIATECLRDLARRVDNITVNTMVQTILSYLDTQQLWVDNVNEQCFPRECMLAVSTSIKSQHFTIMLTSFLRHLEIPHPPPMTRVIVLTAVAIVNDTNPSAINLVVSQLLKVLIQTLELSNRKPPPADLDEQLKLASMIVESVGAVCKNHRTSVDKMETMNEIMNHIKDANRSHLEGFNIILLNLIQCILQVSQTLTDIIPHSPLNDLVQKLLDLSEHSSPEVRIHIQSILQNILLPSKSFEKLVTSQGLSVTEDGVDELLTENASFIRDSLFNGFSNPTNQPANVVALFRTLIILLYRGKSKEVQYSIPMIFKMQKVQRHTPFRLSRSVHLVIASYLQMVSKLYGKTELEQYVQSVLSTRREKNQTCRYLSFDGINLVSKSSQKLRYREREKNKSAACDLINQDQVAQLICSISILSQEYPNLKNLLSKKYNTITRKDLPDFQDESIEITPPVKPIQLFGGSSSSSDQLPNPDISDHPKILTFDSFKQFANFNVDDHGTSSQHSQSSQRHSISNAILMTKDLSFQHVVSNCEESSTKTHSENDLLIRLVLQQTQFEKLKDGELSSTCTLNMNIQAVLEKVI